MIEPSAKMLAEVRITVDDEDIEHFTYEGEPLNMNQQQQDHLKQILGDGMAKVTVSKDLGFKDYGNGGGVLVSVTLTCDQSDPIVSWAVNRAKEIATSNAETFLEEMKPRLVALGLVKAT